MRRKLLAALLAVLMLLALMPSAAFASGEPYIEAFYVNWSAPDQPDRGNSAGVSGNANSWNSKEMFFQDAYYFDYVDADGNHTPIPANDLYAENEGSTAAISVSAHPEYANVLLVDFLTPGTANICYNDNGTVHKFKIGCVLPSVGFSMNSSTTGFSAGDLINHFEITKTGNTFYLVADAEHTISNVYAVNENANAFSVSLDDSNKFATVTVTGELNGSNSCELSYDFTSADGNTFSRHSDIVLTDSRAAFKFRYDPNQAYWDSGIDMSVTPMDIYFYYIDKYGERLLFADALSSDGLSLSVSDQDPSAVRITPNRLGDFRITYTDGSDTYSIPVTVRLPSVGIYTESTASLDALVNNDYFYISSYPAVYYLIPRDDITLTGASLLTKGSNAIHPNVSLSFTPGTDEYATITVTEGLIGENAMALNYSFSNEGSSSSQSNGRTLFFVDNGPGLKFRRPAWNQDNSATEDKNKPLESSLRENVPSYGFDLFVYYVDADGKETDLKAEDLTVSGTDIISISHANVSWADDLVHIGFTGKTGTANLQYTLNGTTYSLPITAALPDNVFCSDSVDGKPITEFIVTNESSTFYIVPEEGWSITSVDSRSGFSYSINDDGIAEITVSDSFISGNLYDFNVNIKRSDNNNSESRYIRIRITDGRASIGFRNVRHPNESLQTKWITSLGYSSDVNFFYAAGEETPIAFNDLSSSNQSVVTLSLAEDKSFVRMEAVGFGTAEIRYTDENGKTYAVTVTVELPEVGFYADYITSTFTYVREYEVTEPNQKLYIVPLDGWTLTRVENPNSGDVFSVSFDPEKDTYATITVTGDNIRSGRNYNVQVWATGPNGRVMDGRYVDVTLIDNQPCLGFYWANHDENGGFSANLDKGFRSSWNCTPYTNHTVFFAYASGDSDPAIINSSTIRVTSSNESVAELTYLNGAYEVQVLGFGETVISCTVDNVTYSMKLTVGLPLVGFYSSDTASKNSYLTSFNVTDENKTFYLLSTDSAVTFTNVICKNAPEGLFDFDYADDGKSVIVTVNDGFEDGKFYTFESSISYNGSSDRPSSNIKLIDANPGLKMREMSWNESDGTFYENPNSPLLSSWSTSKNNGINVKFYYFDGENEIPVNFSELSASGSLVLANFGSYININAMDFGPGSITYTKGNVTAAITVNVSLPYYGFYTSNARSKDSFINGIELPLLTERTAWFISENGFTAEELGSITAKLDNSEFTGWTQELRDDTGANGEALYNLKFTFPEMAYNTDVRLDLTLPNNSRYDTRVRNPLRGAAGYVGDYAIGFAWQDEDTDIIRINEGNWSHGNGSDEIIDTFQIFRELQVAAGIKKTDEQGAVYYEVDDNSKKVAVKINKAWIEEIDGTSGVFSLSDERAVLEMSDYPGADITLFSKQGYTSKILIWAEAEVTINGSTSTHEVAMICETTINPRVSYVRPENDTVEALNEFLEDLAENHTPNSIMTVVLAPTQYSGTIIVPSVFRAGPRGSDLCLIGSVDENDNFTVIRGAIDLNGSATAGIRDLHFKATDDCKVALYGGALLNMNSCSFEGYDIAADSSSGLITLTANNVFTDNAIAVRLDIANVNSDMNANAWTYNTFIKNGTAVQIKSLNDFVSSYYLRIVESNFISNTKDFDVDCAATLYMYRNYYGNIHNQAKDLSTAEILAALHAATTDTKLNQLVTSNSPEIDCISGSRVITNPRWKKPVLEWWGSEIPVSSVFPALAPVTLTAEENYENALVSDWNLATQIVNDEAGNLVLDPDAFIEEGEKQIDVVDQNENPLGTWNFD